MMEATCENCRYIKKGGSEEPCKSCSCNHENYFEAAFTMKNGILEKLKSVEDTLESVANEFCIDYCKYKQYQPEHCDVCPLTKL